MRKTMMITGLAAMLAPIAAQAADVRPAAVSYGAPSAMAPGMRVGAKTGMQSKDDSALGTLLIAALAFGAGYLVREWIHDDHKNDYSPK